MRKPTSWYLVLMLMVILIACWLSWHYVGADIRWRWATYRQGSSFIQVTRPILEHSTVFELYSLDGEHPDGDGETDPSPLKKRFGRWPSYGKMVITTADTRQQLIDALYAGIRANAGIVASCFEPRHGIHASDGHHTVDLVICFTCLQIEGDYDGKPITALTSGQPMALFDHILQLGSVSLGPREEITVRSRKGDQYGSEVAPR